MNDEPIWAEGHLFPETRHMISREEIEAAICKAKVLMADAGLDSDVTYDDLVDWFESEVPVPDIDIGDIVLDPLLVVHELVEIREIMKMGLELSRESLSKNKDKVWEAHLKAIATEMLVARRTHAIEHMRSRLGDIEMCCRDSRIPAKLRADYGRLFVVAEEVISDLQRRQPSGPSGNE
jgi:hypothetical protein